MAAQQTLEKTRRPGEEVERLGEEIYERDIRAKVEADHHGEYVAIDVETGRWALAESRITASRRLRANQPDACDVWMMRVGHATATKLGGSSIVGIRRVPQAE